MSNAPILWGGASSAANSSTASNLQTFLTTSIIGRSPAFPKNYLSTWYFFNQDPTVGIVTTLTATGNRTTNTTFWGSSTTSLLSYITSSATYLRPPASAQIAVTGAAGAQFVESPLFTIDLMDVGATVYYSFDYTPSGTFASGDVDLLIVNYNSGGTYIGTITPTVTNLPTGKVNVSGSFIPTSTASDQYSLRWRSKNASLRTIIIDSLFVGTQTSNLITPTYGLYTPTVSGGTGFANGTSTVRQHNYIQIGNNVLVTGGVSFTGGTSTAGGSYNITLPIATNNFSTIYQATGVASTASGAQGVAGNCNSNSGAQTVNFNLVAFTASTAENMYHVFSYQIQ